MRTRRALTERVDKVLQAIKRQQSKAEQLPEWQEIERVHSFTHEALFRKLEIFRSHYTEEKLSESELQAKLKQVDKDIRATMTPADRAAERRYLRKYAGQISGARELLMQKLLAMKESIQKQRRMGEDEDEEDA